MRTNRIYHGDALELFRKLQDGTVDLVVTDPPFAIEFTPRRTNYNRTQSRVLTGYMEIPAERYYEFTLQWMAHAHRVLKDTGSMYVFSGWTNLRDVLNAVHETGFHVVNHLIWKYQFGVFTKKKYVTSHYHILFCVKDARRYKFNKVMHYPEDVWCIKREYWSGRLKTPTKLPLRLVARILRFSSDEGDVVLDPFIGSGTVAVAAKLLNRRYIGFEVVEEYCRFARRRLRECENEKSLLEDADGK